MRPLATEMTRRPFLSHALAGLAATAILLAASAPAAFAHSEFDLDEAAPGSIVALHLSVENESRTAGTVHVELRFPQPLVIVELPPAEGWTATPVQGAVGGEAIGVLWERPSATADDDPSLPLTIGPLPDAEGRVQFKVVQRYSDGTEDAWISDWPAGAPEPEMPGPVIDLVAGAPGTIPTPSSTPTASAVQTSPAVTATTSVPASPAATAATAATETVASAPATAATATTVSSTTAGTSDTTSTLAVTSPGTVTATPATTDDDDSSNAGVIIGVIAAAVIAAGAAAAIVAKRRKTAR